MTDVLEHLVQAGGAKRTYVGKRRSVYLLILGIVQERVHDLALKPHAVIEWITSLLQITESFVPQHATEPTTFKILVEACGLVCTP